jgi:glycosyltransferase involved in cell wall biosynthesis
VVTEVNENPRSKDRILLSIITVTFNAEAILQKTIDSVANQNSVNLELIVIDGGSTDGTIKIIQKNQDTISEWVSEPDNGIYDAMNKGISKAHGEWIFFLNAGDTFCTDNTVSTFLSDERIETADVIYGDNFIVDTSFEPVRLVRARPLNRKTIRKGLPVSHQSLFVRKLVSPFFDLRYHLKAEYNWLIDILYNNSELRTSYVPHPVIFYPLGGVGQQKFWQNLREYLTVVQRQFGFLQNLRNLPHYTYIVLNFSLRRIFRVNSLRFWNQRDSVSEIRREP